MRRKVCYTFRRVVLHTINRLRALKEGFNVKSGDSLKAVFHAECSSVSTIG